MSWALIAIGVLALCIVLFLRMKHAREQRELNQHSITAEELRLLLATDPNVLLFDVRLPLDLLAYPELIPGARRIPPQDVIDNPAVIPRDKNAVVYCTCPSDKTSRTVLRRAMAKGFSRIRFLKGGLAAWKTMGYPVEPYREEFYLNTPTAAPPAML